MVKECPVCGREFVISWPGGWSYKKAGEYLCSWKCLQQKRKESGKMSEAGGNGTPKGTAAEEGMQTDERDLWQTAAVRNAKMGTFYYDEKYKTVDWRSPYGEEVSLPPEDWKWIGDHIGMILHALGVDE